jgi:TRAP-type uncharacterized transport system substrate-binding protein
MTRPRMKGKTMPCIAYVVAIMAIAWGALSLSTGLGPACAQGVPRALQEGGAESALKERKNAWTVGVAGGLIDGSYMRFADELAKILDDGDNLRVLPIVSYGAAGNLDDLLYLKGVDVAFTQSDVFEYFRTQRKTPNLENRVHYLLRFPVSEMHVLARDEVKSLQDLKGKKVSFGPAGTAASLTGSIVFQRLGVEVQQVLIDNSSALQKLKSGEIDALVRVIGKPVDFFSKIAPGSGLHLVPIQFTKMFADYYTLGEFSSQEYPGLVPQGQKIDTIAVPAVLAVYNWPKNSERYRKVERFVDAMLAKWAKFQQPPFHPKWRDINLNATVPGWTRFAAAEQALQRIATAEAQGQQQAAQQQAMSRDFQAFVDRSDKGNIRSKAERDELFREFLQWREKQGSRR